jgi:hypothetical protein
MPSKADLTSAAKSLRLVLDNLPPAGTPTDGRLRDRLQLAADILSAIAK